MVKGCCFLPPKTRKALDFKGFEVLVKFWLRQSDAMLRIVMLLTLFAVMCCVPNHVPKAHFTREAHITSEGNITFHLRNTSLKKSTCFRKCFFLVRKTGLEPVWMNHTPLKRARLPVPPLPRQQCILYTRKTLLSRAFGKKVLFFSHGRF